ncbi:MAG: hypothetical protein H0U74_04735 [Bradymonadaceae bacterium]|nr:hypothetical protein [Lujinxingiaceae bacterium]
MKSSATISLLAAVLALASLAASTAAAEPKALDTAALCKALPALLVPQLANDQRPAIAHALPTLVASAWTWRAYRNREQKLAIARTYDGVREIHLDQRPIQWELGLSWDLSRLLPSAQDTVLGVAFEHDGLRIHEAKRLCQALRALAPGEAGLADALLLDLERQRIDALLRIYVKGSTGGEKR